MSPQRARARLFFGRCSFKAKLFRYPGPGGWTFARIPARHAPPVTHGWGRTPVLARVDGTEWETSVWHDKTHGTLLAVPKHIRREKDDGDLVQVELSERPAGAPGRYVLTIPAKKTKPAAPVRRARPPRGDGEPPRR